MITRDPDVTRLLDRMEKRGLISRARETRDPDQGRVFGPGASGRSGIVEQQIKEMLEQPTSDCAVIEEDRLLGATTYELPSSHVPTTRRSFLLLLQLTLKKLLLERPEQLYVACAAVRV
jgi:hypothetical protein